ncbi:MAG: tetratricopeptide repeat protein [Rhizobacter sp.]|nr:tetratricopeptide repeat protein [Ferruginibacter sp.]
MFLLCLNTIEAQGGRETLLQELDKTISESGVYDALKHENIQKIKNFYAPVINGPAGNNKLAVQYDYYQALYEEYKIFRFDTAYLYAKQLEDIGTQLKDADKIMPAKIKLMFVLVSAGMFNEASEVLKEIDISRQPDSVKANYYSLKARYYYDLADFVNDQFHTPDYYKWGSINLDSALIFYPPGSFESVYQHGLKSLKMDSLETAYADFHSLMKRKELSQHDQALVTSTLSYIYLRRGDRNSAINYQVMAAIADIKSSTKETFAIYSLSQLLFQEGDFKDASQYIEKAIDDATFYGARQRKVQVSSIMPIIQSSQLNYVQREKKQWIIYAGVVSLILLLLAFLIIVIYRQNKKLKLAQKIIGEAHEKLHEVNTRLQHLNDELHIVNNNLVDVNGKLEEANKIKDEYVGYFFTSNAALFQRIEKFKTTIEEKIHYSKFSEIKYVVNNLNIKNEKEELLKNFDKAFLKLFPHFVEDFNALFTEENKIHLHEGELLNTDLRIYALQRLGIKDNEKIAEILEYSVKSIYAYKTKIRNRATVSREDFDKKVMDIKSI